MPLIEYKPYNPAVASETLIETCNEILTDYEGQGYKLTLRQMYYQLVSRDLIENTTKSYKRLGDIVTRARDGGLIDWGRIVDRTRSLYGKTSYATANEFLQTVANQFSLDLWKGQPRRCMVFVEKEALSQIVGRAASRYSVSYMPNKGYLSASTVWNVAHNHMLHSGTKEFLILHLGDHDPSGIDMTRDIRERLALYSSPYNDDQGRVKVTVKRLALNMDQVVEFDPPPNPAKESDSRFKKYAKLYGDESWELDALEPSVIDGLITEAIEDVLEDRALYDELHGQEARIREQIAKTECSDG